MKELFVHSYILIFSLGLQYYFMNKYKHNPATEMVMELQVGNWKTASLDY